MSELSVVRTIRVDAEMDERIVALGCRAKRQRLAIHPTDDRRGDRIERAPTATAACFASRRTDWSNRARSATSMDSGRRPCIWLTRRYSLVSAFRGSAAPCSGSGSSSIHRCPGSNCDTRRPTSPTIESSQPSSRDSTGWPIEDEAFNIADRTQRRLAKAGLKGRPVPDLIIAAQAELADLTMLHYDADFDLISSVTGQPTLWITPQGSID